MHFTDNPSSLSYFRLAAMTSISQNDITSQPGQEGGILYTNADRLEDEWDENVSLEGEGPAAMMPRVDPPEVVEVREPLPSSWVGKNKEPTNVCKPVGGDFASFQKRLQLHKPSNGWAAHWKICMWISPFFDSSKVS